MSDFPFVFVGLSEDGQSPALHALYGPNQSVSFDLSEDKAIQLIEGLAHFLNECRAKRKERK